MDDIFCIPQPPQFFSDLIVPIYVLFCASIFIIKTHFYPVFVNELLFVVRRKITIVLILSSIALFLFSLKCKMNKEKWGIFFRRISYKKRLSYRKRFSYNFVFGTKSFQSSRLGHMTASERLRSWMRHISNTIYCYSHQ